MADNNKNRDEAEARFARSQKAAEDGRKAMKEHEAEAARVNANMARLKALRLSKQAAEEAAERENPPPAPKRKVGKKAAVA